ncbi:MAG TPA: VOC family protein [Phnomibacter sp.]|nr:VOC family protein [Phnomibacter sp.]
MTIDHIAIYTHRLEELRAFYEKHFGATSNAKYRNPATGFESYFLSFPSGARLELMQKPGIPANANDTVMAQHTGLIHMAFGVSSPEEVDEKARLFQQAGLSILRGPRLTGDGYYEFEMLDPDGNRIEVTTTPHR